MRLFRQVGILTLFLMSGLIIFAYVALPNIAGMILKNIFREGTGCQVSLAHPRINFLERTASVSNVAIQCDGETEEEGFYADKVQAGIKLRPLLNKKAIVTPLEIEGARVKSLNWDSAFIKTLKFVLKKPKDKPNRWKAWVPVVTIKADIENSGSFQFGTKTASIVADEVVFTSSDPVDRPETAVIMEAEAKNARVQVNGLTDKYIGPLSLIAEARGGKVRFSRAYVPGQEVSLIKATVGGYIDAKKDLFFLEGAFSLNSEKFSELLELDPKALRGDFDLNVKLDGPFVNPKVNINLNSSNFSMPFGSMEVDDCRNFKINLDTEVSLANLSLKRLEIEDVFLTKNLDIIIDNGLKTLKPQEFQINPHQLAYLFCKKSDSRVMPKQFASGDFGFAIENDKLNGHLEVPNFDISSYFKRARHVANLQALLSGTLGNPQLNSKVLLKTEDKGVNLESKVDLKLDSELLKINGSIFGSENNLDIVYPFQEGEQLKAGLDLKSFPLIYFTSAEIDSRLNLNAKGEFLSADVTNISGELNIKSIDLQPEFQKFEPSNPIKLVLKDNILNFNGDPFEFQAMNFKLSGSMGVESGYSVKLNIHGEVPKVLANLVGVESIGGKIDSDILLGGSIDSPKVNGKLDLSEGIATFKVGESISGIEKLNANILFDDSTLEIQRCSGRFGDGELKVFGKINSLLDSSQRNGQVAIDGDNLLIEPMTGLAMRVDANMYFLILANYPSILKGDVILTEATYQKEISIQSIIKELTRFIVGSNEDIGLKNPSVSAKSNMMFDIRARSTQGLLIDTSVVRAEVEGDLKITGDIKEPQIGGEVNIVDGNFKINQTNFAVVAGSMKFDGSSDINPNVSLSSQGDLRKRAGDTERIFLNITGPLKNTKVSFSSDGATPPKDIVRQLGIGTGGNQFYLVQSDRKNIGFREVISPSSDLSLSERFAGLTGFDQIRIETAVSTRTGDFVPQVIASRPLPLDLRSTIWTELSGDRASGSRLEYRLSDDLSLYTGWRSQSVTQASTTSSSNFSFGIRFRETFKGISLLKERVKVSE